MIFTSDRTAALEIQGKIMIRGLVSGFLFRIRVQTLVLGVNEVDVVDDRALAVFVF